MNLTRPLVCFDIEGTGIKGQNGQLDISRERIVTLALTYILPGGTRKSHNITCKPGMPISDEATKVHGITNEAVKDCKPFSAFTDWLYQMFTDCDLCGFNLWNYDIPVLWEEFNRVGFNWNLSGVQVIDVGNIFKKKEERTLSAAVKFYCARTHEGAHDAQGDVTATLNVLAAQLDRYDDLTFMSTADLCAFSRFEDRVDLAGKIVRNSLGDAIYNFGKSKGVKVVNDPGYGNWMLRGDFTENTKRVVRMLLNGEML